LVGTLTDEKLSIVENDIKFNVDIINGHKTGFYLDQRDNRLIARKIAGELSVLDCFSYSGGFGINALVGGAKSVCFLDSSKMALEETRENITQNGLSMDKALFIEQDVFRHLRTMRDSMKFSI
jgi:23S rRNA (cytosine1962-C5)-methyltransferase